MTKISEYPIISNPTEDDILIGTDVNSSDVTKNFSIGSIIDLIGDINQGPIGPQGNTGPTGPQGPVGPAGLEWQGEWVSGTSYVADDAVGYDGASWFCILATSGTTAPDLATANWALLASQGAVGPAGPAGPIGPQGPGGGVSYTDGSLNSGTFSQASTFGKIEYNFTRVYVTSSPNNFIGLSSVGVNTGTAYIVQNKSTTIDLIVRPLDNSRFLQPNGFESDINFTVKPNTYARFTLTNITGGSDRVFMVEVIKPLGAAPTLQQVIDEGNTVSGGVSIDVINGSNETIISGGSILVTSSSNVVNVLSDNIYFEKQLGSGSVELKFPNTINAARVINFPNASGTIALQTYKIWRAVINRTSVVRVFIDEIGFTSPTISNPFNGVVYVTKTGFFTSIDPNKLEFISTNLDNSGVVFVTLANQSDGVNPNNEFQVNIYDMTGGQSSTPSGNVTVEIRIYN